MRRVKKQAAQTFAEGIDKSIKTAAAIARYDRNAKRRWRPLKIYLIVTGLFIALVLGLYFYAAPPFSEGQAIVVKDIT